MTTYNTGNPIGSTDSRDRLDNTENMDYLENSTTELTHPDRLGTVRKTRHGMEAEHDAQISAHKVEHDAQMQAFEDGFDGRLAGMAFTRVGSFTSGATLADMRQVLVWEVSQGGDGHEYSWAGAFPKVVAAGATPSTSGGIGAGAWVDRTDVVLRDELAGVGGASLVGYSFNGVADSARTVLSKLRDSAANIEDFGAVGDGISDDTVAFQTANNLLQADTYIALSPGKSYKITGVTFTNKISLGCPNGRAKIISDTGVHWIITTGDLDISIENIDIIPTLNPNINNKTTAVSIEVTNKNFGPGGYAVISGVRVKKDTTTGFYTGIAVKNQAVIFDGCEVVLRESHTNPLAKDGSIANWEVNSGDGILLDGATYSFLRNCKVYYATNAFRSVGQIEEVHFQGCLALINRKCFSFESLSRPANQHRINNCHGVTYLCGIEMGDDTGRNVFCSIESSSIMVQQDASAEQIVYAKLYLDGANINNFQAFNAGTRGSNDIGIYLRTFNGVGARRVMVSGLQCIGVGTGVYLDTNEVNNQIVNVSMLQGQMVGSAPKVYAYGPNNSSTPVRIAYGFPEQENVFPNRLSAPVMLATNYIGLKAASTTSDLIEEQFRIRNVVGNFWIESADASGVLQHNAGIDQGGYFRSKGVYPLADATHYLGAGPLRWTTVFATTGTINTSDAREKTAPLAIDDVVLDAWGDVQLVTFQWLDAVRLKGTDTARWHFGVIAQQVRDAFSARGLDGTRYGLLCYDEWDASDAVFDEDGNVVQEAVEAGNRWGIRSDQCLFLEAAYQRRRCDLIEARLKAAGI